MALAAMLSAGPGQAQDLKIATSLPCLGFPFFVHMQNQLNAEAEKLGGIEVINYDGENQTPKQTADVEAAMVSGVDGLVISPLDSVAMAPAVKQAVDAGIPVVTIDRRVDGVEGILAHVGADNVKGGEAQAQLIVERFPGRRADRQPAGPARRQPGDRPQPGRAQHPRPDEGQVRVRRRADGELPARGGGLGDRVDPRRPRLAAGRDRGGQRRHGARRAAGGAGAGARHRDHRLRRAARGAGLGARRRAARDDRAVAGRPEPAGAWTRWSSSCARGRSPSRWCC